MYNSASKEFDSTYKVNIIVYNDGSCKYGPPGIFTSTCQVDYVILSCNIFIYFHKFFDIICGETKLFELL